ncbi:MAG: hypothetical protein F6J96_22710 [Symploca sp. SIO1C2]|nr:hypothetical protein [Symploca sp. SIO1C2]
MQGGRRKKAGGRRQEAGGRRQEKFFTTIMKIPFSASPRPRVPVSVLTISIQADMLLFQSRDRSSIYRCKPSFI